MATSNPSKAIASGNGAVVSIGNQTGVGTDTWVPINEIQNFKGTGRKRNVTVVTSFSSGGVQRKLDTVLDYGQYSLDIFYVPNDAGQLAVANANVVGGKWDFQIQLPINAEAGQTTKGNLIAFSAIVTEFNTDFEIEKADGLQVVLDIDGPITITQGS
jgi:hypothetical protein